MTIGSLKPSTGNESRKNKQAIVDERSPLLPTKHSGDGGFDEFNGASFSGAVFNLSTTIVGAGIMALPATTKVLGLIPGVALIIFMAFLTESSIELLLRFSRTSKSVSYRGLMGDAFGDFGRMLIQLCVLVNNIGVLIVYMIIIGDVLSGTTSGGIHHAGVLEGWFGEHWWNGRFFVLLITTLAIFAPLASLKRIGMSLGTITVSGFARLIPFSALEYRKEYRKVFIEGEGSQKELGIPRAWSYENWIFRY